MQWIFTESGMPQLTPKDQLPQTLILHQGNDIAPTEILQKDCSEPHSTLGVTDTPNRSQTGELQRLDKKCSEHATAILSNSVTTSDAVLAYKIYHLTSVVYSLDTTCIHYQETI
jgi:hypothetical protein